MVGNATAVAVFLILGLTYLFFKFMGGKSSKTQSTGRYSSYSSSSNSWNDYGNPQYPYEQPSQTYAPQPAYQSYDAPPPPPESKKRLERKYSRIDDDYSSLEQVTDALSRAGLESSNLIVGIDFTKSNEWTGSRSFNRRSLHHLGDEPNPYEQAISIIGRTLSKFDEDNLIPCFGFGDASTHDQEVFSFYPDERFCEGFEEVLSRYHELVPQLRLAGPTSFAPVIEMAITIVEQSGGQYHVLLLIADGQVTRSVDTGRGQLSPQEKKTVESIVKASRYPLSIILVGVGDGPWDMMKEFDDNIPARDFDNFQFVNFTEIMSKHVDRSRKEAEFALSALMEIPSQYKATLELNILGARRGNAINRVPLPPPHYGRASLGTPKPSRNNSFQPTAPSSRGLERPVGTSQSASYFDNNVRSSPPVGTSQSASYFDNNVCPICLTDPKNMAFGCGHQTCCDCGQDLESCPICRETIQTRIKLY